MKCSKCGFEINQNSKFCPKCGAPNNPTVNNNVDPDATVAVDHNLFRTLGADHTPHAQTPVYTPTETNDPDATVAVGSRVYQNNTQQDLDATVSVNYGNTDQSSAVSEINDSIPSFDDSIQTGDDSLDSTVALNSGFSAGSSDSDITVRLDTNDNAHTSAQSSKPPKKRKKNKKNKKTLVIVISVIAAVVIIIAALITLMFTGIIPNPFDNKDDQKNEQQDEEEETVEPDTTETESAVPESDPVESETASDEPAAETSETNNTEPYDTSDTVTEAPEPKPDVTALTEDILIGTWSGEIDLGQYFESFSSEIELPTLPVSGTYVFDGNGVLTRTIDTEQLAAIIAYIGELNDSAIMNLIASAALAFDGDKTFTYTISDNQVIIDDGSSVLIYDNNTLTGVLAGCELTLEK